MVGGALSSSALGLVLPMFCWLQTNPVSWEVGRLTADKAHFHAGLVHYFAVRRHCLCR